MKRPLSIATLLAAIFLGAPLHAQQEQMRPGLWEHSFTIQSQSGEMERALREMQQQLESMPPEQRKMMEQMMAAQGMQLGAGDQSISVCISKEQAARGMVPQRDDNCRQEVVERRGNTIKFTFQCAGNPPSSGEGEVTFTSPTSYSGKSTVNTTVNGQAERMVITQSGKWLSHDCGGLKSK